MKTDPKELIERFIRGDQSALGSIYDHYGPTLYGVVLKIVKDGATAEDMVQETFIKAWNKRASFDQAKGSFFTWILNIARNRAIDHTRSKRFQISDRIQSPDSIVSNSVRSKQQINIDAIGLDNVVSKLDEKYRELIDLVYFQGYTQQEISIEFDIPIGTVKTRIRKALQELRKVFHVWIFPLFLSFLSGIITT